MTPEELEQYLHTHIPITQAMAVRVDGVDPEIRLSAPLEPNINHRHTAFGGSLATLATLAAWSTLRVRLGDGARLVIAKQTTDYLRPVEGRFVAVCHAPAEDEWLRFMAAYERKGRARITLEAEVECNGEVAVRFSGEFAALSHTP